MKSLMASVLLALMVLPHTAFAWWDPDFQYRKEIVLDTSPNGGSVAAALTNFPVLVRLDSSNFNFDDARADGADLRFVAADERTALPYAIESFDGKLGLAMIWVGVPTLAGNGQTRIWMYFGNVSASSTASPEQSLDPQFRAVYRFGAGDGTAQDATLNRNHAIGIVRGERAGWIGGAASFDSNSTLTLPATHTLDVDPTQGFTFEAWIKARDAAGNGVLYQAGTGANAMIVGIDAGAPFVEVTSDGVVTKTAGVAALGSAWSYIAVVGDMQSVTLFINGEPVSTLRTPMPALAGGGTLGGDGTSDTRRPRFVGDIDEVRLSSTARPSAYLAASYASERQGARLAQLGPTQEPAENGFGYFGVIFENVTLDAWVVIAILGLMGVGSWIVMWRKAAYVGRTARANALFLSSFNRIKGDVLDLDLLSDLTPDDWQELKHSSLYRIYRLGVTEITARRAEDGRAVFSPETLQAIRASLDEAQVSETQTLDRGVVLLTISIAGAPFIGLLGTVLGVMITFAAIAASGEVNVSSIAPGIAAALLATVAGLAVAIPALFGYNYISSRNGDLAAKTQTFTDRLLTRFAEQQRRGLMPRAVA